MNIVFIGSGNLATNLAMALNKAGHHIIQIFSHTLDNAKVLADRLKCEYTADLKDLKDADIYISSLKDSVSSNVWSQLKIGERLIVHTSGSLSMEELAPFAANYGVLYPLMTLSKTKEIDFRNVPILIEANDEQTEGVVKDLAESISSEVVLTSSKQREQMHLAAVWANNFSNHMFTVAKMITDKNNLPFSLLIPLIDETANKVRTLSPLEAQTGPAIRYDENIIKKQQENSPQGFQELYKLISESIHHIAAQKNEKLL